MYAKTKSASARAWITREGVDRNALPRIQVLEALEVWVKICGSGGDCCRKVLVDIQLRLFWFVDGHRGSHLDGGKLVDRVSGWTRNCPLFGSQAFAKQPLCN